MSGYVYRWVEHRQLGDLVLKTHTHWTVLLCSRAIPDAQSDRGGGA